MKCGYCGVEVLIPFKCNFCGLTFCEHHRLPENHHCSNLPRDPEFWYQKKKIMEETASEETKPPLSFVKTKREDTRQKKASSKKERPRKILRSAKTVGAVIVGLIVLGVFALNWGNFFAQLVMPYFTDTAQIEADIFSLINVERENRGLPTLLEDEALVVMACAWSKHLAETGNLTHGDLEGRIAQVGYSTYLCGEILAMYGGWTLNLGEKFVDMWLQSPSHYQIMMTASSGYMGVGISKGSQGFFAVVDFRFV